MAGIKLIHHVNVPISDRERTREWYEKVLCAEYLDRGPIRDRQLQMRIGTGEMHFTDSANPSQGGHFCRGSGRLGRDHSKLGQSFSPLLPLSRR